MCVCVCSLGTNAISALMSQTLPVCHPSAGLGRALAAAETLVCVLANAGRRPERDTHMIGTRQQIWLTSVCVCARATAAGELYLANSTHYFRAACCKVGLWWWRPLPGRPGRVEETGERASCAACVARLCAAAALALC